METCGPNATPQQGHEATLTNPAPPRAGDPSTIGGWTIRGRLGEGGMGVVHLGVNNSAVAAIKTISPQLLDQPTSRHRLRREADAAQLVVSPRVARLIQADLEADPAYLAFEYVPGPTIQQRVDRRGSLAGEELLAFAAGLADALTAIHAVGVTHRDIKPSNIISTPYGPVVIDFGIATVAEATSLTSTGLAIGTATWMAPEQARGHRVTPACDVFSWAATVAFAASGRAPFGAGRPDAVIYRILHDEPAIDGLPECLEHLVRWALSKDPHARPSATQVRDALIAAFRPAQGDVPADVAVTELMERTWIQASIPVIGYLDRTETDTKQSRFLSRRVRRPATLALVTLPFLLLALVTGMGLATQRSKASIAQGEEASSPSTTPVDASVTNSASRSTSPEPATIVTPNTTESAQSSATTTATTAIVALDPLTPQAAYEKLLRSPINPSALPTGITSDGPEEFVWAAGGLPGPGTVDYRLMASGSSLTVSGDVSVFFNLADAASLYDGVRINLDQYTGTAITDLPSGRAYCYDDEYEGSRCLALHETLVIDVRAYRHDSSSGNYDGDANTAVALLSTMTQHVEAVLHT